MGPPPPYPTTDLVSGLVPLIKKIAENPLIGEEKKGDLRGVHVYKFKIKSIQFLLSYRMIKTGLELIMIGPHENYYRELKGYLKRR